MPQDILEHFRLETVHNTTSGLLEHPVWNGGDKPYYHRWQPIREIGEGACGTVRSEKDVETGELRAVKLIRKRKLPNNFDWRRELTVMATLASVSTSTVGRRRVELLPRMADFVC